MIWCKISAFSIPCGGEIFIVRFETQNGNVKDGKDVDNLDLILQEELKKRYFDAVNSFVNKIKNDPNIIAVILCGSLAYDTVWEKSDIDTTVIVRDQNIKYENYCILEDDILINVSVVVRSGFKRFIEKAIGGQFIQSYFSKGKILYTTDDSLYEYLEDIKTLGKDDIALCVFYNACELLGVAEKCNKWLTVKDDQMYAQYYLLKAADSIARIEVCTNGESPSREAIIKALTINPDLIAPYYTEAMSHLYSRDELQKAIDKIDEYLVEKIDYIKQPVLEYMADQEIKTVTILCNHFHVDSHFIIYIFDFLAEKEVIEKVSKTIRITPKGKLAVEEIGYQYIPDYN